VLCAWQIAGAIYNARPTRIWRFSEVGDDWQLVRRRMKNFRDRLVRAGYREIGWAWVVHPNQSGTGQHIHVYATGDVPSRVVRSAALGVGFGASVDTRPFTRTRRGTEYPFHHIIDGGKVDSVRIDLGQHLARNGGRLIHSAGPFWKTLSGFPVRSRKEAIKAMVGRGDEPR
jgi:hypothetical protein